MLDKRVVVAEIIAYLQDQLADAKHKQDLIQAQEIERLLVMYRFLPLRDYSSEDVIIPSALVELKLDQVSAFYFVAPKGGGLVMRIEQYPVQVITPQSPLGEKLLGKKVGEKFEVEVQGKVRTYQVVQIS